MGESTPSVHPQPFWGALFVKSVTPKVFIDIQTLHNDCSHIEDVYLIFCAPFVNIFAV